MRKRRHQPSLDNRQDENGLPNPFPSAPLRLGKYVLTITPKRGRKTVEIFCAVYGAKKFIDRVTQEKPFVWIDAHSIETEDMIIYCNPHMERIIEHRYSAAEKAWQLPCPYDRIADRISGTVNE